MPIHHLVHASRKLSDLTALVLSAFALVDRILAEAGTDKTRIVSATVILHDIEDKPLVDRVWAEWIGDDPAHWPDRSCHGVTLHAGNRIEVHVVAVRG